MLNKTFIGLSLLIIALGPQCLQADEVDIRFSGFATLGLSYNDSDELKFHRDFLMESNDGWAINTDSSLGGQVNIVFDESWDAVVQVVYQDRLSHDLNDYFEWAFLRYRFNRNLSFRAGRLQADMYLLSEYKAVGYAYLWARPPVEFYSPPASISQLNGFDLQYSMNVGQGFLQAKIAYGSSEAKMSSSLDSFMLAFDQIKIANVTYSKNNWKLMASYADIRIDDFKSAGFNNLIDGIGNVPAVLWPQANEIFQGLSSNGHSIDYLALGYQFESDSIIIQSELGSTVSEWDLLPSYYNGYISAGYKHNNWTYYATFSGVEPKYNVDPVPQPFIPPSLPAPLAAGLLALHGGATSAIILSGMEQQTISLGLSRNIATNISLKLQVDRTFIEENGAALWTFSTPINSSTAVTIFSTSLHLVF